MTTSAALVTARPEDRAATGAQAAVIVVCRKPGARQILDRELSKRYGADYQIVVCDRRSWRPGCGLRDLLAAVIGGIGAQDRDGIKARQRSGPSTPRRSGAPQLAGATGNPRSPFSTPSHWARSTTG
jgi:hypothetical protein